MRFTRICVRKKNKRSRLDRKEGTAFVAGRMLGRKLLFCRRFLLPLAFVFVEEDFAHAHKVRGHLDVFVGLDVLERIFEAEDGRGRQRHLLVRAGGAHIRQFLRFGNIYNQIAFFRMFADYLSGVHLFARYNEKSSTRLQVVEYIYKRIASFHFAAFYALASLISDKELNPDYIIPAAFDKRIADTVAAAVREATEKSGVARIKD